MPSGGKSSQNVVQQLEEVKKKLNLLDGDRKAYYESSQWVIKQNRSKISDMRKEVKDLRVMKAKKLAADEVVVNKGLEQNEKERNALRDKPGTVAIQRMDEKVCDAQKKLDMEKYKTGKKMAQLEELQTQHNQMQKDAADAVATDAGESEEAENLRNLENRLDKAELKCKEAEHIHKTYLQIKKKLMDEQMTFDGNLDSLQNEIIKAKQELKELQAMNNDAQIARDTAKSELEKQERQVYEERKKREMELAEVRKEAEEKRLQHERIERRIARGSLTQEELSPAEKQALTGEDEQQKITTYEEAMKYIKEATGVSDTKEVVVRFETQGETQQHLEELKKEGEKHISRLREEKEKLQNEFEEMKYSGEAKLSSGQRMLEEFQTHLEEEETRKDESEEKLEGSSKILLKVRSGIEHLSEKLKHLKAPSSQVQKAKISPSSDEYVLDRLSQCEEKLLKVLEELDGKELEDVLKEMEDEDFQAENKLPPYNTRVKFPASQKDMIYDEDEDSGEDEGDIMTRNTIKRQAQQVLEQRNRRKVTKRKKPKK